MERCYPHLPQTMPFPVYTPTIGNIHTPQAPSAPTPQAQNGMENGMYHCQLKIQEGPTWPLAHGFGPGSQLVINGTTAPKADRFHLELVSTKGVAFHFNPRFRENAVVRNSMTGSSWDKEERRGAPTLSPGQYFSIAIFCQEAGFQVLVNGQVFTHFQHRHNHLWITHFRVGGEVTLTGAFYYAKRTNNPSIQPNSSQNLDVENGNNWLLPRGFGPGAKLVLHGTVDPNAERFALNLMSRKGIAFHFNPRFHEKVLVRNTLTGNEWGHEEREGWTNLAPGQFFIIEFLCQNEGIQVVVNGCLFTHYKHRHDPLTLTHLQFEGDAKLHQAYYYPLLA